MKKIFLIFIIIFGLYLPCVVGAEEIELDWQKSFGGSKNDSFTDYKVTTSGDIVVIGTTYSNDIDGITKTGEEYNAMIFKYDKDGNLLWKKSYGGSRYTSFYDFELTSLDEIVAVGYTYSKDIDGLVVKGETAAIVVKYDKDGNLLWQKSFGGSKSEIFDDILLTKNDEIIAMGSVYSSDIEGVENHGSQDALIVKYDKDGNILWQNSFGGSQRDFFDEIVLTDNEELIVRGATLSTDIKDFTTNGNYDAILLKYDKDGNILWQNSFGGSKEDRFQSFKLNNNDEILVRGYTTSTDIDGLTTNGDRDGILIKYDKDGKVIWRKNFGGSGYDTLYDFVFLSNGHFIISGNYKSTDISNLSNKGKQDAVLMRYDENGNLIWMKNFGGSEDDFINGIQLTSNNEVVIKGHTKSSDMEEITFKGVQDAIIAKYDVNGNLLWMNNFGGNETDFFLAYSLTSNDDVVALGYTYSTDIPNITNQGGMDTVIIKYDKDGKIVWQKSFGGNGSDYLTKYTLINSDKIIVGGEFNSTDIEGFQNFGEIDVAIFKYSIKYNIDNLTNENGTFSVIQNGSYAIVTPTPDEGYEFDKIIIKDKTGSVLDLDVTKIEDGTYSFPLNDDVSVEVLFKEIIENPKTGINNIIDDIMTICLLFLVGLFVMNNYRKSYEL